MVDIVGVTSMYGKPFPRPIATVAEAVADEERKLVNVKATSYVTALRYRFGIVRLLIDPARLTCWR
jgi:hypothetical protein